MSDQTSTAGLGLDSKHRVALVLFWSLLPSLAIWTGLHVFKSAVWSYVLYHGIALIAVVAGRALWRPTVIKASLLQIVLLIVAAIVFSSSACFLYEIFGQ